MDEFDYIINYFSSAGSVFNINRDDLGKLTQIDFHKYLTRIAKIDNPILYDHIIKYLEYKDDVSIFNEERKKYIEKKLLNDEDDNIKDEWYTEYIIQYFFGDNYYNFIINLFNMLSYYRSINGNFISLKNLKIYEKFDNISKLSKKEKKDLFREYYQKANFIREMFYDDMRKVKNHCYKRLVDSALKLNKDSNIYNQELSNKYNIDVYYLNGEDFYTFVRTFSIDRSDLSDKDNYINSNLNRLGYSFSYISNKNIGTTDFKQKNVVLLYDKIDPNNISYVHHADIHSSKRIKQDGYLSNKVNELLSPSSLMAMTNGYNEVYINGNNIVPTALICYDNITNDDVLFAKKYNLSIVLMNTSKYRRDDGRYEDFFDNSYTL